MGLNAYITSIFGPYLPAAFSWSKAELALVGALTILTLVWIPFIGRMTDLWGVRRMALIGVVCYPISCLALGVMNGNIYIFYAIAVGQILFCTSTTTVVYTRVIAERFDRSRGLALAVCASGPAIAGGIAGPVLTGVNEAINWRAGYLTLSVYCAVFGLAAILLLGKGLKPNNPRTKRRAAREDYSRIFSSPIFWIILPSTLLCSFPHALAYSQIKVMLLDHGVTSTLAGTMVSLCAGGVLVVDWLLATCLTRCRRILWRQSEWACHA